MWAAIALRKVYMERHKSALKAARQSEKRKNRNQQSRSALRTEVKKLRTALASAPKNLNEAKEKLPALLNNVQRVLGKAASKNLIKKGTASRYVSRLSSAVHRILNP